MEYPRLVAVETTNRCNAKCSFCPNNALQRERRTMSDDLFAKIIEDCRAFPLPAIEPFLQGEPFVDSRIFERLELINRKLPDTALRLYSNGAALTPEKSDHLRELKVKKLFISLNTIDKDRYAEIVGLPLDKTMDNLVHLSNCGDKNGHHRPVAESIVVRLTLTPESSAAEIREFKNMCRKLGVKPMTVGLFNYKGDIHSTLPVPSYPCEHIDRLDILANGETTLCCMDHEGQYGWGSVIEKSVLEVFNNKKARHVREGHRKGHRKDIDPCGRCNLFWPSFSGMSPTAKVATGIRYLHYYLKNRPNRPPVSM